MKLKKTGFNQERFIIFFLLFLVYIITFYPLTKTGFSVGDDIDFYTELGKDNFHQTIKNTALRQGRFYFLFMRYIQIFSLSTYNTVFFDLLHILPIAFSFILFSKLIQRVFRSDAITLFSAVFMALSFQIAGFHSCTTAYPFFFTLAFCILLCSFHLFLSFYEKNKKLFLYLSATTMFIASLFYEAFILYYLVFLMIAIWKNNLFAGRTRENIGKTFKELIPFIVGGTVYLILYFAFQHFYPPQYDGVNFSKNFSIWGVFKTAFVMSKLAFPLQNFYDYKNLLIYRNMNIDGVFDIYRLDLDVFIMGLIIMVLAYYSMNRYKAIKYIHLLWGFLAGICLVYIPLLVVSSSSRYYLQNWHSYVPTFFSFFGYTLSLLMVLFAILNLLSFSSITRKIFQVIVCIGLFYISSITQTTNRAITKDLEISEFRLEMADFAFKQEVIPKLNTNTPICFEQAHSTMSYSGQWVTTQYFTWRDFLNKQVGKEYNIFDSYKDFVLENKSEEMVWVCFFRQGAKTDDAIMYFAKLKGEDLPKTQNEIICDTIIALYRSTYKMFNVSIATENSNDTVFINDLPVSSLGNLHSANMFFTTKKGHNSSVMQITGKNLIASSLSVSNILNYGEILNSYSLTTLSKEEKINILIETIKNDTSWYNLIKRKAKEKNISVEQSLRDDAVWYMEVNG